MQRSFLEAAHEQNLARREALQLGSVRRVLARRPEKIAEEQSAALGSPRHQAERHLAVPEGNAEPIAFAILLCHCETPSGFGS